MAGHLVEDERRLHCCPYSAPFLTTKQDSLFMGQGPQEWEDFKAKTHALAVQTIVTSAA